MGMLPSNSAAGVTSVVSTAQVLVPGAMSFGGGMMMWLDPVKFGGLAEFNYGIGHMMDLNAKAGYSGHEAYFGADVEFALAPPRLRSNVMFSVAAGAHVHKKFGLDGTLIASLPLRPGIASVALDADINFTDPETTVPVNLVLGFERSLSRTVAVNGELGVNITDSQNYLSLGLTFFP